MVLRIRMTGRRRPRSMLSKLAATAGLGALLALAVGPSSGTSSNCVRAAEAASSSSSSPPVQVSLRAPWAAPPLLLEALEAVPDARAFFDLLTHITSAGLADAALSDEQVYARAKALLEQNGAFATPGAEQLWDLSLALHSESPKIEAFWHLYRTTGVADLFEKQAQDPAACGSFAVLNEREVVCDGTSLEDALVASASATKGAASQDEIVVPFDHTLHSAHLTHAQARKLPSVTLYADLSSANFADLHTTLQRLALGGAPVPIRYTLRWRPPAQSSSARDDTLYLSGYGAALDLKKVDYLVIDDRKLKEDVDVSDTAAGEAASSSEHLARASTQALEDRRWLQEHMGAKAGETGAEDLGYEPTSEELELIGYQAVQVVASSAEPLRALKELSQNFPYHLKRLTKVVVGAKLEYELAMNQGRIISAGANDVWLNGKEIDAKDFSPLALLRRLRSEGNLVQSLTDPLRGIGLEPSKALDVLSNATLGRAFVHAGTETVLVDASDRIERGLKTIDGKDAEETAPEGTRAIVWLNDLEKDDAFAHWPSSLQTLLRPSRPGAPPMIRRNIFHVVLALDLSRKESARFLADSVIPASQRMGLRWGVVPVVDPAEPELSSQLSRMFLHVYDSLGAEGAGKFLHRTVATGDMRAQRVDLDAARKEFIAVLSPVEERDAIDRVLDSIKAGAHAAARMNSAGAWAHRVGFDLAEAPRGGVFVNGQGFPFTPAFNQQLGQIVQNQLQALLPLIYYGTLKEDADLSTFFYDLEDTLPFKSPLLGATSKRNSTISTKLLNLASFEPALLLNGPLASYVENDEQSVNATVLIAGDLDTEEGQRLVRSSSEALRRGGFRLGFVHSPNENAAVSSRSTSTALFVLLQAQRNVPVDLLDAVLSGDASGEAKEALQASNDEIQQAAAKVWWHQATPLVEELNLQDGRLAIIANGKAVSGFNISKIGASDIQMLARSEASKRGSLVHEVLLGEGILSKHAHERSSQIALLSGALGADYAPDAAAEGIFQSQPTSRMEITKKIEAELSTFEIGDRATAKFRFSVVLDPVSETAQKWSSVLELVAAWPDTYVKVILNPSNLLQSVPIKRFYRYASARAPTFAAADQAQTRSTIVFSGMPEEAVLTLDLDTPSVWLAMAEDAVYDLDNIRLSGLPAASRKYGVSAVYELKKILIEGHARDALSNDIPRGLQLLLKTTDGSEQLDTIVMENLAYLQFRAKPGLWHLSLREGKSTEIYDMVSVGNLGWFSPEVSKTGDIVTLASLEGLTIYPQVRKKPGMERVEILEALDPREGRAEAEGSVIGAAKSLFGSLTKKIDTASKGMRGKSPHADINIFTVASGHLYERMTYIMILSVLRHTEHSVKFWFIENFLSPSFKEFIPHFAREYGFAYELVSYAWPHWLRGQKEKQRVIWGNKILFLDVLFPLDLEKVIFVDADQIVRADMMELVRTDLKGAPYGYPPMGNDSVDMDNFRFWEHGYWKDFLRGRPYHISALYVVDLARFRQVAAGDTLRGQYQALSQDPHSLANLDQDLPNNLQHHLPIHTLEKEWLWCETWCSYEWLPRARTIDLCSNPKTKEPKLDRARRQIPEWSVLDDEVARFAARLGSENKIGTNVVSKAQTKEQGRSSKVEKEQPGKRPHDEL